MEKSMNELRRCKWLKDILYEKTDMKRMGMLTWRACGIAMWGFSVSVIHGCFFMQDVCIIKALMKTMKMTRGYIRIRRWKKNWGVNVRTMSLGRVMCTWRACETWDIASFSICVSMNWRRK
jgi:hypothetical protein